MATHNPPDLNLDPPGLRKFAWTIAAIVAGVFGLGLSWLLTRPIPHWPWVIATILFVWGALVPASLGPLYRRWMQLGNLMNRITSPLVLGVIFYGIVAPLGVIMKAAGRARIPRRFEPTLPSYRVTSRRLSRTDLEKPF